MNSADLKRILTTHKITEQQWEAAHENPDRVTKLITSKGNYWLKKAAPARGIFRYQALNFFSWAMRLPLLKAVPQPGGSHAIVNEINRLQTMSSAGVLVPDLVAHDSHWLLLAEMGEPVVQLFKSPQTNQQSRQYLFKLCLHAIKQLHGKQLYLSQGFVRNMLISESTNEVAFIDFEDDPLEVMSLPEAQARDLLLFINSTARFFMQDANFLQRSVSEFLNNHHAEMVTALRETSQRLQWITKLPFQKWLGHDYQKLKVGLLALKEV